MKYIFLTAMLMLNTLVFAQDINVSTSNSVEFPNPVPTKLITVNEYNSEVETIHNVSFEEDLVLLETITSQDGNKVVTNLHNKLNGHKVTSTYTLVDDNTLERVFKGDSNMTVYYTRNDKKLKYNKN